MLLVETVAQLLSGRQGRELCKSPGRSDLRGDVEKYLCRRRATAVELPRLVDQGANPLVARYREPEALRLCSDESVDLGDRAPTTCETLDDVEKSRRQAGSDLDHPSMVPAEVLRRCANSVTALQRRPWNGK